MQVKDVMTRNVISVGANEPVVKAARLMLQNRISGLPVVDAEGELVGIVTEGDFLRRGELGTQRRRPKWLEFIVGPGRLAEEYVHTSGRKVEEIMTPDPATVAEDDTLEDVVEIMERRHIKRLPVMRGGRMVGIVSRANLMHALASIAREMPAPAGGDSTIRDKYSGGARPAALGAARQRRRQERHCGIVGHRSPTSASAADWSSPPRTSPGVKQVHDHLVWVEPMSGMAFPSAEDEAKQGNAAA